MSLLMFTVIIAEITDIYIFTQHFSKERTSEKKHTGSRYLMMIKANLSLISSSHREINFTSLWLSPVR